MQPNMYPDIDSMVEEFVASAYHHKPYSNSDSKHYVDIGKYGVRSYSAIAGQATPANQPAPDNVEATVRLAVGGVPHGMKPELLRWVVKHVTGVTPLAVRDGRRNTKPVGQSDPAKRGRVPIGMYFITVRASDVDAILFESGRALCCNNYIWVPQGPLVAFNAVAPVLKQRGVTRCHPLSFERGRGENK